MSGYSEKTARELDRYTRKLVRSQPSWLKKLFDEEKLIFGIDKQGALCIEIRNDVNPQTRDHACALITKYIMKHPCKNISVLDVH